MNQTRKNLLLSALAGAIMGAGMLVGIWVSNNNDHSSRSGFLFSFPSSSKLDKVLQVIDERYVDSVNIDEIENKAVQSVMSQLDPHSQFVDANTYRTINESLEGNFEGIGIEFHVINDSLLVVSVIQDGPCEKEGLLAGDKIVAIEGESIIGVKNSDIINKLHGPKGTDVVLSVVRPGVKGVMDFHVTRGQVPINSVEVHYMLNTETGYIKISQFGATTHEEFLKAMADLKNKGLKSLVLDLRGNGGGYLRAATALADEFLPNKQLIVYTQGRKQPREDYYATGGGVFEKGPLVVLIDENTASASEILAGALQDTERAIIVGRRSFGKGLVQDQIKFPDGSGLRLTIARYYTPLGRSIQKPYDKGIEAYKNEVGYRLKHGELFHADSNKMAFNDLIQYHTANGKIVYGGGGIMPDYFIALDTSRNALFTTITENGILTKYGYEFICKNDASLKTYKSLNDFLTGFSLNEKKLNEILKMASSKGLKYNLVGVKSAANPINTQLKAMVARWFWGEEGFYKVINAEDKMIAESVNIISTGQLEQESLNNMAKVKH
ncbi:S41 family peptidase [Solitalea koreensis]|uniref:C-terminal processing peptidase-3. Serine peptidase. MEROPS family S41A n=1 Tax=Solitalea koreensis TaxID=543615 RepID=A0A521AP57_9SPHI|nr:S41 family peptidase [Solitalea koreensis]SMO36587.1 C-terminal processing peptidase-3. Serine peptidase. MEROPS family S41A [Solitalea koreensis]